MSAGSTAQRLRQALVADNPHCDLPWQFWWAASPTARAWTVRTGPAAGRAWDALASRDGLRVQLGRASRLGGP